MSSFFLLDNVVCPALPLHGGSDGHPDNFVYWQGTSSSGGQSGKDAKITGVNCCRCPDDNGDSWTFADASGPARGAFIYLEVTAPEAVDMVEVNNRLHKCKENQKRALGQ